MEDQIAYHHISDAPGLTLSEGLFGNFSFDRHYHLDYHIGLVVKGVQLQNFQGQSTLLGPGQIVLMPPDEMHDGLSHDRQSYIQRMFRISPEMLDEYMTDFAGKNSQAKFNGVILEDQALWQKLVSLHQALGERKSLAPLSVEETWLLTLEPLFAQLNETKIQDIKGGISNKDKQQVMEYCHAQLGENITLEDLAELCELSKFQFLRRFKKSTGVTPHTWLIRLRLERACMMLKHGKRNIADVANEVGFYDQSHFNKAFRQAYGVAPSIFQN